MMLYIPKTDDYLKILTDQQVKDFVAIDFSEYLKSIKEKFYSKLNEEQNLRKVAKSLYIFLTTPDEIEKYAKIMQSNSSANCIHRYNIAYNCYNIMILNILDPELQLINTKPMIKDKLKELLNELKKFKVQTILVLEYKKRNVRKIFRSNIKLIANDSDVHKAFISMHQSIMTKIKGYACEDWIVLDVIKKHSIKIFEC